MNLYHKNQYNCKKQYSQFVKEETKLVLYVLNLFAYRRAKLIPFFLIHCCRSRKMSNKASKLTKKTTKDHAPNLTYPSMSCERKYTAETIV